MFEGIIESKDVLIFLQKRWLLDQYKKAKHFLELGMFYNVKFWLREPKKDKIYYFRINKQFRAYCVTVNKELRVFRIDNHQK